MRVLPGPALVTSLALAWPATGAASGLEGAWCSDSEMLHIDAYGIGFNDHTVCTVDTLPVSLDTSGHWSSPVACRNVRFVGYDDAGNIQTHEEPISGLTQVSLRGAADGTLILSTDLHAEDTHFLPCD